MYLSKETPGSLMCADIHVQYHVCGRASASTHTFDISSILYIEAIHVFSGEVCGALMLKVHIRVCIIVCAYVRQF